MVDARLRDRQGGPRVVGGLLPRGLWATLCGMPGRTPILLSALALASCAEPAEPAEFAELCGQTGPVRVLELAPEERVAALWGLRGSGERIVVLAGTGEGEPVFNIPTPASVTAYSVGRCGEDPVVLGENIVSVREDLRWPGVLLGCRGELQGDLVVLDPAGAAEPGLLVPGGCDGDSTAHGLVDIEPIDETTARVLLYPWPADPWDGAGAPIVLLEAVQRVGLYWSVRTYEDELFALDAGGAVVRVALADGATEVEQYDALGFSVSQDGRYLLWQDALTSIDDGSGAPVGDLVLRDRVEGGDSVLGQGSFAKNRPGFRGDHVRIPRGPELGERVVALPGLEVLDLPPGRRFVRALDDGRLVVSSDAFTGPWYLMDFQGGEFMVTSSTGSASLGEDALYVWEGRDLADPRRPGSYWRYPYDGGPRELLARRMTALSTFLGDERRVVTTLDIGDDWVGRLVLVEPETLAERPIDDRVAAAALLGEAALGPDTIGYSVVDGARSGVWVARLAAGE